MSEDAKQAVMPRTGQQYSISHGDYQAIVTQQGATLRVLRYRGKDLIASFRQDQAIPCSNGCVLVPFPNRIEDGEYRFDGKTYHMPIDEHERGTAIHGYGYRYYWQLDELSESSVSLSWRTPSLPYYPFDLLVTVSYVLDEDGLTMIVSAKNQGGERAPWAFGIHPWLSNGQDHRGDAIQADNEACSLLVPCRTHVRVNDRLIPTGEETVQGDYDLTDGPSLKGRSFDDAWCDPQRDRQGRSAAVLTRPDGIRLTLWGDKTINAWQVCTGTGFDASFRPAGVAVEPMTAYANAFRTGKDLVALEPGQTYTTQVGYRAEQA
ncbi:aldose 1-epimerase family protein [Bifidobacterium actinocoloniiforme DSM 22766]|uniref:Aldose 1-epimerase family protein n=2 Tax=Bifidobacterium actinocoloniiforme TaxID=638619 RepID=A0A086Z0Y7_9BIFI|nr:aldose 1-epimerase family protein [Bifidobacterium actinocoloniiforme]AKV55371.1 aldose epimerase [Bifidobacterium actinocoloniiforme DSM 22766]KFI40187.1 aldose 1-epimerase family protein [Bifidobacterium actinocoloniiforme DSM 22766]